MLRIDDVPEANDDDEVLGKVIYKKSKSPKSLSDHLVADKDNIEHFIAMLKNYGIKKSMVDVPEEALAEFAKCHTPEAHIKSLSATVKDKDIFIKFLVEQLAKKDSKLEAYSLAEMEESLAQGTFSQDNILAASGTERTVVNDIVEADALPYEEGMAQAQVDDMSMYY